jgi:hypothetical protein
MRHAAIKSPSPLAACAHRPCSSSCGDGITWLTWLADKHCEHCFIQISSLPSVTCGPTSCRYAQALRWSTRHQDEDGHPISWTMFDSVGRRCMPSLHCTSYAAPGLGTTGRTGRRGGAAKPRRVQPSAVSAPASAATRDLSDLPGASPSVPYHVNHPDIGYHARSRQVPQSS